MNLYREEHQPHRHDHRDVVHGELHEPLSEADVRLATDELAKLERQLALQEYELVEAVVSEVEDRCFTILSRPDDGTLPEVVVTLKAALEEARDIYLR